MPELARFNRPSRDVLIFVPVSPDFASLRAGLITIAPTALTFWRLRTSC